MMPETQLPADAGDGFVTYDALAGPDLDAARWGPARLRLPTGGEHVPLDPNAELAVGEGMAPKRTERRLEHLTGGKLDTRRPATFAADLPLGGGGPGEPFVHVVEAPYEDFHDDFTTFRECEITLDEADRQRPGGSTATSCTRPTAPEPPRGARRSRQPLGLGRKSASPFVKPSAARAFVG